MDKVIVLMSTYNGERYLEEQMDSVLNQQGVDIELLIRDDGSSDATIKIIKKYSEKYDNVTYIEGNNVKPAKSFLELIKIAPECEYYALCDQDDVWEEDKLCTAIQKIEKTDSNQPVMYYSNLKIVDEELNFYRLSHTKKMYNDCKYSALTENLCTGCTVVFNETTKKMVAEKLPEWCTMHDAWIYLVCKFFGQCIYDESSHILYRQHSDNVIGTYLKKNVFRTYKSKLLRLLQRDFQPRYENARNFYECFGDILSEKDEEKVLEIINYKKNLKSRMRLLFDKDIKSTTLFSEICFRLHVLWGTV